MDYAAQQWQGISLVSNDEPPGGQSDHKGWTRYREREREREVLRERETNGENRSRFRARWQPLLCLTEQCNPLLLLLLIPLPLVFLARLASRVVWWKCCFAMAVFQLPLTRKAGLL